MTAQFGRDTVCYTEYGRRHLHLEISAYKNLRASGFSTIDRGASLVSQSNAAHDESEPRSTVRGGDHREGCARKAHEKRPQRLWWSSEHRSERPRSMNRCCAQLSVHAAPPRGAPAWQQSLPRDAREPVLGCESTLSHVTRRRLLPCQRGGDRPRVRGQLRAAAVHRSRVLGPMF